MSNLTKTAAIREARSCVHIMRAGRTSFEIVGPYIMNRLSGPSTSMSADSWVKARRVRAVWAAEIALSLMGKLTDQARIAIDRASDEDCSIPALVAAGLAVL